MSFPDLAFIDGAVCDAADARVPLQDRGYLLGDGLFETLRTHRGKIAFPALHRERLVEGLNRIGFPDDVVAEYDRALSALVDAAQARWQGDLYLRINITGGLMQDISTVARPAVTGICRALGNVEVKPAHLVTWEQTLPRQGPLTGIKSLSFLPYIMARRFAAKHGAQDALLLNDAGRIAECSTSNIMARIGDTVHAPGTSEGALGGVTRHVLLEHLREQGTPIQEQLGTDQLLEADEVWITNTTRGVVPVERIDGTDIKPGPMVAALQHAYKSILEGS